MEAYIAAFDRHWNLALEDCLETWSRKVKRKAPALGKLFSNTYSQQNYFTLKRNFIFTDDQRKSRVGVRLYM